MKVLFGIAAVVASLGAARLGPSQRPLSFRPANLKWEQPFGPGGMSLAFVVGKLGDHHPASYFIKFAPGLKTGWHIHTHAYEAVVLQGTFTAEQQGGAEEQLPPGSFLTQPGKKNHRNGCLGPEECLIFIHYQLGADGQAMTADGKPIR
jgi:quercetin dioxygenase-like cupin family protein